MAYPTLNQNEVISALYNQIISIQTNAKNIAGVYGKLLESMRVEGGMHGDTKLYIETDCLASSAWGMDDEAGNLLELHRPTGPATQAISIDHFRQIAVTLDDYMTKRAFADEGSFSQFNSVIRGWVADTKKVYDATTFNVAVGNISPENDKQIVTVVESDYPSLGQGVAEVLADTIVALGDPSRDYNDLEFLRSYDESDLVVVWNAKYVNQIKKIDLPALFHKEGLIDKFEDYVLPARYFGAGVMTVAEITAGQTIRSAIEQVIEGVHYFAGDKLPVGLKNVSNVYEEDPGLVCIVTTKGALPFMSSFSVGTSFFNPKSLTETQYLTWSHNTIEHLKGKPFIKIVKE